MKIKSLHVCLLFFIIILASCEGKRTYNRIPMPKGFEGVYIGMSLKELKSIKPNLTQDSVPDSKVFFDEKSGNSFFTGEHPGYVRYDLTKGKLTSIWLSYSSKDRDETQNKAPGLIKGAIELWGDDFEKLVHFKVFKHRGKGTFMYPVYKWIKGDITILLTPANQYLFSDDELDSEIYIFDIVICQPRHSELDPKQFQAQKSLKMFSASYPTLPITMAWCLSSIGNNYMQTFFERIWSAALGVCFPSRCLFNN